MTEEYTVVFLEGKMPVIQEPKGYTEWKSFKTELSKFEKQAENINRIWVNIFREENIYCTHVPFSLANNHPYWEFICYNKMHVITEGFIERFTLGDIAYSLQVKFRG